MKLSRDAKLLILVLLLCGTAAALLSVGEKQPATEVLKPHRTTYRSKADGLRALYLTLQRLGFATERWRRPLMSFDMPGPGVLVIADPVTPIAEKEWKAIADWVRGGNSLLLIADGRTLAVPFHATVAWESKGTTSAHACQPSYLVRGVRRLAVERGLRITQGEGAAATGLPSVPG
jgi:hypothetical protein